MREEEAGVVIVGDGRGICYRVCHTTYTKLYCDSAYEIFLVFVHFISGRQVLINVH